jgi:hypothetical protein
LLQRFLSVARCGYTNSGLLQRHGRDILHEHVVIDAQQAEAGGIGKAVPLVLVLA